ncbi:DUF998 domain-containing protein [Mannheimia sp. AT1]|uniref:DUF998 domain-containing protein n=1 Tax=Mannheimia cairinae TaxID=3025936 RepID=A0ABT5MMH1_9PAST|nr:DUF998 domain-containing protein [Mannheimia cairinae]MDD0823217.1 DUF998 domain-containing protein [Mannheimia cairinae]MDD0825757.1 DUF998 domain-containing protein [Mannheimia cairinae]
MSLTLEQIKLLKQLANNIYMKVDWFKTLIQQLAHISKTIENYFTSGSFGVKFYPFLMHPCVRKSCAFLIFIVAIISSFSGLFYLVAEHFTILFSERSLTTYFHHSTLELLIPVGTLIGEKTSQLSPLSNVMSIMFKLQAGIFFFIYAIGITHITHNKLRVIGLILAFFFSVGCSLIAGIQNGEHSEFGFYNLGASITFLIGNLTLIIAGLDTDTPSIRYFKRFSIIAGIIGLSCIIVTMCLPTVFSPLIERAGIYTIMIWEIIAGFAMINRLRKLP